MRCIYRRTWLGDWPKTKVVRKWRCSRKAVGVIEYIDNFDNSLHRAKLCRQHIKCACKDGAKEIKV